jgi:hypothetical protein
MRDRGLFAATLLLIALPSFAQNSPPAQPGWLVDLRTGCRVWSAEPNPRQTITWSGACPSQLAQGQGVLRYFENGRASSRYEGELRDGKANGAGVFFQVDGARYDGAWRDGKRDGSGVFSWGSGNRYEGEWHDDRQNGHGVLVLGDGSRYDGTWRDDKPDGVGAYSDAYGGYEGEWRDGKRNGNGVFTATDGSRYDGAWRDDKPNGRGVSVWANGDRYDGEWRDDKPDGAGSLQTPNGTFDGIWKAGCLRVGGRLLAINVEPAACR